ncbi:ArsR/SmtB family transcription factor [Nonomuraea soli]|uniref:DNA-binding transcriptional ArsR family regulator n=1 Tax=Nonomuraea soli TaxID=1032476 RepID=A0A7W0CTI8_9ACTN|nr:helix-turn-helix domain-containing protein [Nonomuraea soli]MBA2897076.1 DNA-binding transcriptional ArsR family regulator [Nonomuraea soli]
MEVHIAAEELGDLRLARSPLRELLGSAATVLRPGRGRAHAAWLGAALPALRPLTVPMVWELAADPPGFLLPAPPRLNVDLDGELDLVRASDPGLVRGELERRYGSAVPPSVRELLEHPERGLATLAGELAVYWKAALDEVWPRVKALLELDLIYRGQLIVSGGLRSLFDDLGLVVRPGPPSEGLVLVPSVFMRPGRHGRVITYSARGIGNLWSLQEPDLGALAALVGETRGRLLELLELPRTTIDLAALAGVGAPAVSHHLAVLHAAGMVWKVRHGRKVYYQRTLKASQLMAPADIALHGPLAL